MPISYRTNGNAYIKQTLDSTIVLSFEVDDYLIFSGPLKSIPALFQGGMTRPELAEELRKLSLAMSDVNTIADKILEALHFVKALSPLEEIKKCPLELINFGELGKIEFIQFGSLNEYNEVYAQESSKKRVN